MTERKFTPATHYIAKLIRLEDGSPVALAKHQRLILDHTLTPRASGRFPFTTVVWSEPKKSGKTSIAAWVGSWVLNCQGPRAEVLVVANDLEQSIARVFSEMVRVQQAHPALKRRIKKATEGVLLLNDGASAKPVALDFSGESGANPSLVVHDESWGIMSERARRLYDELTPPPTRPLGLRWVSSYAGYSNESTTLEDLYKRGLAGKPVRGLPDSRANGPLFMFWSHTPRMAWQTKGYYEAQRQELRTRAFLRLHENRWVTSEGSWLPPGLLEAAVDRAVIERPPEEGARHRGFVDNSGGSNDDMVLCIAHASNGKRIIDGLWHQAGRPPFDPVKVIDGFAEMLRRYRISHVWGDTFGGQYFMSEYAKRGIGYTVCPLSPSELYEACEVGFNKGDICLVNHARLLEQLAALLEKGGKIVHRYSGHDDFSNACAGALWMLAQDSIYDTPAVIVASGRRISADGPMTYGQRGGQGPESWFDRVQVSRSSGGAHASGRIDWRDSPWDLGGDE